MEVEEASSLYEGVLAEVWREKLPSSRAPSKIFSFLKENVMEKITLMVS